MLFPELFATLALQSAQAAGEAYVPPRWDRSAEPRFLRPGEVPHPYFATIAGIPGYVRLDCLVTVSGSAEDCRVEAVAPRGIGFDRAALAQSRDYRFFPATRDGQRVEARVTFGVSFPADEMPDEVDPLLWPQPPEHLLAAMRPVGEALHRLVDARKEGWDVDPDRVSTTEKLVGKVSEELRAENVEAIALSLARTLTVAEAQALLAAPDPIKAWAGLEEAMSAAPEFQNLSGRFQRMVRDRYCAIYDCAITPEPGN